MLYQARHAFVHRFKSSSAASQNLGLTLSLAAPFATLLSFPLSPVFEEFAPAPSWLSDESWTMSWKLLRAASATSADLLKAADSINSNKSAHARGNSSRPAKIWRRLLNTRATPLSVRTRVSAHCFSAVSREWWMRILFFEFTASLGGGTSAAEVDMVFTCSSKGNNTCWKMNTTLYVMSYILHGNEVSFERTINGKNLSTTL